MDKISFVGLMTLSMPLIVLSAPLVLLLRFVPGETVVKRIPGVLFRANLDLVRGFPLVPKLRCSLAGGLYRYSPLLSGAVYKFFNLGVLLLLWAFLLAAAGTIARS